MSMSTITCPDPPTRSSVWQMLNEAWGWFCGNLSSTNMAALNERQIQFVPGGHNHNGTAGTNISSTAVEKKHFDLNRCAVGWMDYFNHTAGGANVYAYALLAGSGTAALATTTAHTAAMSGTCLIDYNPKAAAAPGNSELDIRALTAYDTTNPFNTNWTIVGAWAVPNGAYATWDQAVYNVRWGFNTTNQPFFYFNLDQPTGATVGTLGFDYQVVVRKL